MADVKLCDACILDGKLNPRVTYAWGWKGLRRLHLCAEHKALTTDSSDDQLRMINQVEQILKNDGVTWMRERSRERPKPRFSIRVVSDEYGACPRCGAYWGHPSSPELGKGLNWPNRQKVDQYWKCYNPKCTAGYYDPKTGKVVEDKLSPEEDKEMARRVAESVKGKTVTVHEYGSDKVEKFTIK